MSEMLVFERKHNVEFRFRELQMLLWKGHLEVILVQPPTQSRAVASTGLGQLQLCVTEHLESARVGLTKCCGTLLVSTQNVRRQYVY